VQQCIDAYLSTLATELSAFYALVSKAAGPQTPLLLIGGGSQIPGIRDTLSRHTWKGPIHLWQHAEYAAVLGAAWPKQAPKNPVKEPAPQAPEPAVAPKPTGKAPAQAEHQPSSLPETITGLSARQCSDFTAGNAMCDVEYLRTFTLDNALVWFRGNLPPGAKAACIQKFVAGDGITLYHFYIDANGRPLINPYTHRRVVYAVRLDSPLDSQFHGSPIILFRLQAK
jgi:hypothetical protein